MTLKELGAALETKGFKCARSTLPPMDPEVAELLQNYTEEVQEAIREGEEYEVISGKKLMGNVSTLILQNGPVGKIQTVSKNLLDCGIDILAPACGLSATTPVSHIKAMTEMAKRT